MLGGPGILPVPHRLEACATKGGRDAHTTVDQGQLNARRARSPMLRQKVSSWGLIHFAAYGGESGQDISSGVLQEIFGVLAGVARRHPYHNEIIQENLSGPAFPGYGHGPGDDHDGLIGVLRQVFGSDPENQSGDIRTAKPEDIGAVDAVFQRLAKGLPDFYFAVRQFGLQFQRNPLTALTPAQGWAAYSSNHQPEQQASRPTR